MKFHYQAKSKEGELQVGFVEAAGKDSAIAILSSHGLFILTLEAAEHQRWYDRISGYVSRVRRKDLVVFARQFSTLLEARLPLTATLKTLYDQTSHPILREAIDQIAQDVSSGLSLSQAMERHESIFPPFYVSMIRSAEVIGNLESVSGFLADYLEREYEIASKVRAALIYPAVVVALFLVVGFIMLGFVFPQIRPVFEESGVELPFFTKIFLGLGSFIATWWLGIIILTLIAFTMIGNYFASEEGKALWDDLKVRLPVLRKIYLPLSLTRLSNVMAMLLKGGVPMTQALEISGQSINNVLYQDIMDDISQAVRQGESLSNALKRHADYFPPLVSQMLVVGEATGQIDKMFARLASFYNREADGVINNLVELIQPALMIGIGLMVGLLFASLLIPLYRLTATIQ